MRKITIAAWAASLALCAGSAFASTFNITLTDSVGGTGTFEAPLTGGTITSFSLTRDGVTYDRLNHGYGTGGIIWFPNGGSSGLTPLSGSVCNDVAPNTAQCVDFGIAISGIALFGVITCSTNGCDGLPAETNTFSIQHVPIVLISPNSDPGGLTVGDSLTFVISVDSVEPPAGSTWERLFISGIKAIGPDRTNSYVDDTSCSELSGLDDASVLFCPSWVWEPPPLSGGTAPIAGDLMSFNVTFPEPGSYLVYIESAFAEFDGASNQSLPRSYPDIFNALVITVSNSAVGLLEELFDDVVAIGKPGKSLRNKVQLAQTYLEANDDAATCAVLADFNKQVKAQIGKKAISRTVGDKLITDATAIMTAIGCFD